MSTLHNQLVVAEREDVARGIRTLLKTPLLTERADPEAFDLVRRRADPIVRWFDYTCGWTLTVEPRLGYVRLFKVGAGRDASRPARRARGRHAPFDRRRYTLLCVTAAELLSTPVTTIGLLADRVGQACAADDVLPGFDTAHHGERRAFVDVLRLLESLSAIEVIDGSSDTFVDSADAKVLYRVDSTVLMRLLAAPNGPSQLGVPAKQVRARFADTIGLLARERRYGDPDAEHSTVSDTQRNLGLRHSLLRRLFDDPVVHRADLSTDQLDYLASPSGRQIVRRAAEQAGFLLEERAEGLLLVDPDALSTDTKFPDDAGIAKVAALLILDRIVAVPEGLTEAELEHLAARALRRFPGWAKTYRSADGARRLATEATAVLSDFDLVHAVAERIVARPAAARYALAAVTATDDPGHRAEQVTDDEGTLW